MKAIKKIINVNGIEYVTVEKSGIVKAYLNGFFGWTSVWADTYPALARRIYMVRVGGQ